MSTIWEAPREIKKAYGALSILQMQALIITTSTEIESLRILSTGWTNSYMPECFMPKCSLPQRFRFRSELRCASPVVYRYDVDDIFLIGQNTEMLK